MIRKFVTVFRFSSGKIFMWNDKQPTPKKVSTPENVQKISCGPSHYAAIGQSGNLYTFGNGQYGKLGHGQQKNVQQPKLVEFFQKKNIRVKDVICCDKHTIVLTTNGKVYTFGWGGKTHSFGWGKINLSFLAKILKSPAGLLGHGNTISHSLPQLVKTLEFHQNIDRISAGKYFNIALTKIGDVYQWGKGQYGVFGNGNNQNFDSPTLNQYFDYLRSYQYLEIKKIKSCASFSIALMNNHRLYGWGNNQSGQISIQSKFDIQNQMAVISPTQIIREGYENQKVTSFDVSQNILIFETGTGQFWWSGMKTAYKPQKINLPKKTKIKLFGAGSSSFAIVTEDNHIFSKNDFIKISSNDDEIDIKTGIRKLDGKKIFGGNIIEIGGQYQTRYAIIQN